MDYKAILNIIDKYRPSMEDAELKLENGKLPKFDLSRGKDHIYCVEWGDAKRLQMEINSYNKMREEIEHLLKA